MRPGGGKQKGAQFERDVCKQLSLWVSNGQREDLFWRSAMSGGRATVGKRAGKDHAKHAGDISATHQLGHLLTDHFYIECKHVKDLSLESWMLRGTGLMAGYWKTACEQAKEHDLEPMMIVRQNLSEVMLIVRCTNLLAPNVTGVSFLNPHGFIARMMRPKADLFNFDAVVSREFKEPIVRREFLKPGEMSRILEERTPALRPKLQRYRG